MSLWTVISYLQQRLNGRIGSKDADAPSRPPQALTLVVPKKSELERSEANTHARGTSGNRYAVDQAAAVTQARCG